MNLDAEEIQMGSRLPPILEAFSFSYALELFYQMFQRQVKIITSAITQSVFPVSDSAATPLNLSFHSDSQPKYIEWSHKNIIFPLFIVSTLCKTSITAEGKQTAISCLDKVPSRLCIASWLEYSFLLGF